MKEKLDNIFKEWSGENAETIIPLPQSGSYRKYFRIQSANHQAIGVYNSDKSENKAFITFTKHFLTQKLNVPHLYAENLKDNVYLLQDLGDENLFSFLPDNKTDDKFSEKTIEFYKTALNELIKFQIKASSKLDYSVCYPRNSFDRQSMMWDLHYFKYYFLKLTQTPFNEQRLEDDFNSFADFLLEANNEFFMYRDFQSRNIMIKNGKLYFIDYQGGRKGALQYDVASLLYDAKANVPQNVRELLLEFYLSNLPEAIEVSTNDFLKYYYGFVLIRIMQALGAYGFRGIYEKKAHFLKSIPYALNNIKYLNLNKLLPNGLSELSSVLEHIADSNVFNNIGMTENTDKLTVSINSFSYKSGIPVDYSGNDGGFVFDCRPLHNPGRYEEFKSLNGKDIPVVEFLNNQTDVQEFLADVKSIIEKAINNYLNREFSHLMINFGCTGGQHRSVYCAEKISEFVKSRFEVNVLLNHTELKKMDLTK